MVSTGDVVLVVVLEEVSFDGGRVDVMRIIVVLVPKVRLIKVLTSLDSEYLGIESVPLTVWAFTSGPEVFSGTISCCFNRVFFDIKQGRPVNNVTQLIVLFYLHFY